MKENYPANLDDFINRAVIEERILHTFSSSRPGALELMFADSSPDAVKNLCVKVPKPQAVIVEGVCRLLGMNKQEFLTVLVSEAINRTLGGFEEHHGLDVDAYIEKTLSDAGYIMNDDGSIVLGGE